VAMAARRWRRTTDMVMVAVAVAAFVVLMLASRQWHSFTSNDLGFMSEKWLAEYNAHHG